MIDRLLDQRAHNWAKFDSVLGYTHCEYSVRDGIDDCHTIHRMGADGARFSPSAHGRPYRINTYGNSFTHCDQVSDGETWQGYLAAHLGEPIRNLGTGGHGVYQAWRRMEREESSPHAAEHIILNLFEDDHRRSVMSWRYIDLWKAGTRAAAARPRRPPPRRPTSTIRPGITLCGTWTGASLSSGARTARIPPTSTRSATSTGQWRRSRTTVLPHRDGQEARR